MNVNAFQRKIKNWKKQFPKAVNKSIRKLLKSIKTEVREEYSGKTFNVRTGKTKRAIRYSYSSRRMSAKVFFDKSRKYIARFLEVGTVKLTGKPVMEPLKRKYTPKLSADILASIMLEYRRG